MPRPHTTRELPTEEYLARARRRSPRWVMPVLAAVVVLLGLGIALVAYHNFGSKPLDAQVTAYHSANDHVTMTVQITRSQADRPVKCVLRARSRDGVEIGTLTVRIKAGSKQTSLTRTVPTTARPVAADVKSCQYQ